MSNSSCGSGEMTTDFHAADTHTYTLSFCSAGLPFQVIIGRPGPAAHNRTFGGNWSMAHALPSNAWHIQESHKIIKIWCQYVVDLRFHCSRDQWYESHAI